MNPFLSDIVLGKLVMKIGSYIFVRSHFFKLLLSYMKLKKKVIFWDFIIITFVFCVIDIPVLEEKSLRIFNHSSRSHGLLSIRTRGKPTSLLN